ncbi:MAG TPA: ABC transporter permease [Candidatus Cloacimonadota bacterium]|nr:ABC transporter permease [Candidatus Cloacimonadota bacterium]
MLFKNVLFALKTFRKNRVSLGIAIIGLALSLVASALILSYCLFYWNHDKSVSNQSEWYRLRLSHSFEGIEVHESGFYLQTAGMIIGELPQIKDHVIMHNNILDISLKCDGKRIAINDECRVTANLPEHYKMRIIYGNRDSLLVDKSSMIISKSFSQKYFGNENPVGKQIMVRDRPRYVISGVFEDLPQNLHLRSDIYTLIPSSLTSITEGDDYLLTGHIRVRIPNPQDVPKVEAAINKMLASNAELSNPGGRKTVSLDPISKIHFMGKLEEDQPTVNLMSVNAVMVIGALMLLAAIFNFINIVALSWQQRRDEFAVRRSVGALRQNIFAQLLTEYISYFLIAILLSGLLYLLVAKVFYNLVGFYTNPTLVQTLVAVLGMILVVFISGFLSAGHFSRGMLSTVEERHKKRAVGIKAILYAELAIGFLFISLAGVIGVGYSSILNRDPGFEADNTFQYKYVTLEGIEHPMFYESNALRERIRAIPGVTLESATNYSVVTDRLDMNSGFFEAYLELGSTKGPQQIMAYMVGASADFFTKRKVKILSGSLPTADKMNAVVVNQSFVERYSQADSPLGKTIRPLGGEEGLFFEIAAVANDAWFFPAHIQMIPMIYVVNPGQLQFFQISYQPGQKYEVWSKLDKLFEDVSSNGVLGFRSLDVAEEFSRFYQPDRVYVTLTILFAIIICVVSIMGVYAVSAQQFYRQLKDIAIRKACGAEFRHILALLLKSYIWLFCVAGLVGFIGSYYLTKLFFARFALSVAYPWWVLPLSVIVLFIVVFLPLYLNSRKAWKADPIKYLQSE